MATLIAKNWLSLDHRMTKLLNLICYSDWPPMQKNSSLDLSISTLPYPYSFAIYDCRQK